MPRPSAGTRCRFCAGSAACLAAGIVVFAATPSHLGPANTPAGALLGVESAFGSVHRDPCDPPHGAAHGCQVADPPPQAR